MYVLGINSYLHDASAALIKDGRVIFATEAWRPGKTVEHVPAHASTNGTVTAAIR